MKFKVIIVILGFLYINSKSLLSQTTGDIKFDQEIKYFLVEAIESQRNAMLEEFFRDNSDNLYRQMYDDGRFLMANYIEFRPDSAFQIFNPLGYKIFLIPKNVVLNSQCYTSFHFSDTVFIYRKKHCLSQEKEFINEIDELDTSTLAGWDESIVERFRQASKISTRFFFINFLPYQPYGDLPLGCYIDGKLKMIDTENDFYETVEEYILSKFGSVTKYMEILIEQTNNCSIYRGMTFDNAVNTLMKSPFFQQQCLKADSLKVLSLFLDQVDLCCHLSVHQRHLFHKRLFEPDWLSPSNFCGEQTRMGCLWKKDVYEFCKSILTQAQLEKFQHYYDTKINKEERAAWSILMIHYSKQKHATNQDLGPVQKYFMEHYSGKGEIIQTGGGMCL